MAVLIKKKIAYYAANTVQLTVKEDPFIVCAFTRILKRIIKKYLVLKYFLSTLQVLVIKRYPAYHLSLELAK